MSPRRARQRLETPAGPDQELEAPTTDSSSGAAQGLLDEALEAARAPGARDGSPPESGKATPQPASARPGQSRRRSRPAVGSELSAEPVATAPATPATPTAPKTRSRTRRTSPPSKPVPSDAAGSDTVLASIQALEDQIDQMRRNAHPAVDGFAAAPGARDTEPSPDASTPAGEVATMAPFAPAPVDRQSRRAKRRAAPAVDDEATLPDVPVITASSVEDAEPADPVRRSSARQPRATSRDTDRRRRTLLVVGALLAVIVVIGVVSVTALTSDDSGGPAEPSTAARTRDVTLAFDPVTTPEGVVVDRVWVLRGATGDRFVGTLTFSNPTASPLETSFVEVIPKSLARSVRDIEFDPEPTVLRADPVVEYKIPVAADSEVVARYKIKVADSGASRSRLEEWADAAEDARASATTTSTSTTTTTTTSTTSAPPPAPALAPAPAPPPAPAPVLAPAPPAGPPGAIVVRAVSGSIPGTFRYVGTSGSAALTTSGSQGSAQSASIPVAPGTYSWTQVAAPPGSGVVGIACSDGESGGSGTTATYRVQPGETVACTWTNS